MQLCSKAFLLPHDRRKKNSADMAGNFKALWRNCCYQFKSTKVPFRRPQFKAMWRRTETTTGTATPLFFGVVVVVCEWGPPGSRTATTDDWDRKVYHNGVHRRLQSCMAGRRDGSHFTVAGVSRPLLTPALRRR